MPRTPGGRDGAARDGPEYLVRARSALFVARIKGVVSKHEREREVTMETDREHSDAGSSAEDKDTLPRDEDVGSFAEGQERCQTTRTSVPSPRARRRCRATRTSVPSPRARRRCRATRTSAPSPTAKSPATTNSGEQRPVAERLGDEVGARAGAGLRHRARHVRAHGVVGECAARRRAPLRCAPRAGRRTVSAKDGPRLRR